jgi:ferritin
MLSEKMQEALNRQLNAELYSAYLYLSMSAYFEFISLPGFASWMRAQAQEEVMHAMKFYNYLKKQRARIVMAAIEGPPTSWESPLAVFEFTLAHEKKVTGLINGLMTLATEEKDDASVNFLQWFVSEQVEEESSAAEVVAKLKMAGDAVSKLLVLDGQLGQRVFTLPSTRAKEEKQ